MEVTFFQKNDRNAWWVLKKAIPLHSQNGNGYAKRGKKKPPGA